MQEFPGSCRPSGFVLAETLDWARGWRRDSRRERLSPKKGKSLAAGRMPWRGAQKDGVFLGVPFFCRRAPHSEAFFTSDIQIVSGIRYAEAGSFLFAERDFFPKFFRMFFIASSPLGTPEN